MFLYLPIGLYFVQFTFFAENFMLRKLYSRFDGRRCFSFWNFLRYAIAESMYKRLYFWYEYLIVTMKLNDWLKTILEIEEEEKYCNYLNDVGRLL